MASERTRVTKHSEGDISGGKEKNDDKTGPEQSSFEVTAVL